MGKIKHQINGKKMERGSESIIIPVPTELFEHYIHIYIHMDLSFVNGVSFFLTTSQDIGYNYCLHVITIDDKKVCIKNLCKTIKE